MCLGYCRYKMHKYDSRQQYIWTVSACLQYRCELVSAYLICLFTGSRDVVLHITEIAKRAEDDRQGTRIPGMRPRTNV